MGGSLSRRRLGWQEPAAIGVAGWLLALAVLPALAHVAAELAERPATLHLLTSARLWTLFARSTVLSVLVTVAALAIGVPLGVAFARAAFPLRRLLLSTHLLVAFLPPFLPALGWFHLFGRDGYVGSEASSGVLFSEIGLVLILAACLAPIATALTALGVLGVDPSLEDAARVVLPCAAPAITLAALVIFTLSFSELGVPMFLRVHVYPAMLFTRLGGMDFSPGEAAVLVLPLLLLAASLLGIERRAGGHRALASLGLPHAARGALFRGAHALPFAALASIAALVSAAPLAALAAHAVTGSALSAVSAWVGDAPWNSVRAATAAAALATPIGLVIGHAGSPAELSGGERQRVAIARALVLEPIALLLDEALANLDVALKSELLSLLSRLVRERRLPVLVVTHDPREAGQIADRIVVLEAGRIVQAGTAADLARRPATPFVRTFAREISSSGDTDA